MAEKFESGVFTLKTQQMFSIQSTPEKFPKATASDNLDIAWKRSVLRWGIYKCTNVFHWYFPISQLFEINVTYSIRPIHSVCHGRLITLSWCHRLEKVHFERCNFNSKCANVLCWYFPIHLNLSEINVTPPIRPMNSVYHVQLITPRPHKPEEIEKTTIPGHFGLLFKENSGREIAWLSCSHPFETALFWGAYRQVKVCKCFLLIFSHTYLKLPFNLC